MSAHSDREHATWSASATERNWNCPGALALTMDLPEQTSEAADWGTVAHEVAEICLRESREAADFIGQTRKGKKFEIEVDDELAETAQIYVDFVRKRFGECNASDSDDPALWGSLAIEQRFSLEALRPPFEAGGTADAVIHAPVARSLDVVDLKGGRGVAVDATENKQLRTYALGAMLANPGLKVDTITVTIVQPRAPHPAGRIRSETFHVADLVDWTGDLLKAMDRSKEALDSLERHVGTSQLPQKAWDMTYLKPGPWCDKTFCKARGFCPALQQAAYDAAGVWFDDLDQPRMANSPDAMSPEALAQALDAADMIEGWVNAVRAYAHAQAEMGIAIPDYMLVEKIGRRRWKDEAGAEAKLTGLLEAPYTRKLMSPAQAEKALGKKRAGEIADLIEKPVTGTNLVRADKTTRPAVRPAVEQHFSILD